MTSGADPSLLQELEQIRAAAAQQSEEIGEDVRAAEDEIAEANRQIHEENQQLFEELDRQAEQRRAERAGETTGSARPDRTTPQQPERSFGFEDDQDFRDGPLEHSAPERPARPQHRPEPDADDEDDE